MAVISTKYEIVKLSKGYCIESPLANQAGFDDLESLLETIEGVWLSDLDAAIAAIVVGGTTRFSLDVSYDAQVTYNFAFTTLTEKKTNGAVSDLSPDYGKFGDASDLIHAQKIVEIFIDRVQDALDGIIQDETVFVRIDQL